jgi:hypothetical protein
VEISLWDMLEAAMAADGTSAPTTDEKAAEIPTEVPPSDPVQGRPRRARRRASVA